MYTQKIDPWEAQDHLTLHGEVEVHHSPQVVEEELLPQMVMGMGMEMMIGIDNLPQGEEEEVVAMMVMEMEEITHPHRQTMVNHIINRIEGTGGFM